VVRFTGGAGIHRTESWSYAANLAYGVTTTRDPQTGTTDVLTYGDMAMNPRGRPIRCKVT